MARSACLAIGIFAAVLVTSAMAGVGDPQIMTDHSVYRGELACSTLDRNIADAYRVYKDRYGHEPKTDLEKVVALWIWKSEHYMHACDNKVYYGPDNPDAVQREGGPPWLGRDGWMDSKDCQMTQFSFSFGLCYSIHAQMAALIGHALGDMARVRCPEIHGHTPLEVKIDGRWVLVDFTMGIMVFDDDGRPVSLEEILARKKAGDKEWFASPKRGGPYKLNMSPFGDRLDGYSPVRWIQMNFGYNAMPIVYSLRPGETFTRYLDPGLADGETWMFWGRDYFPLNGKPKHGPFRNVTFMDDYPVGEMRRGRGRTYYGNGVFEYAPPLADDRWREGAANEKGAAWRDGALRGQGEDAHVTFEHLSPYVIAARPVEGGDRDWKVMEEKCVDGAVVTGQAVGVVPVKVSVDGGQTWQPVGKAEGGFRLDFTDAVKGRHFYLLRFDLAPKSGLKDLKVRTVTQVGRGVFPRLTESGCKITYEASGQHAIHGGPSQDLAERFRRKDLEKDGYRVYGIRGKGPIRHAAGVVRVDGPADARWSVEFSVDGGKTWRTGVKDVRTGGPGKQWEDGKAGYIWAQMDFASNKSDEVLIRFGKGNILHAQVFAACETKNTSPLTVTYGWIEGDKAKEHTHQIAAGKAADTWTVPTGKGVHTKWVRFEVK